MTPRDSRLVVVVVVVLALVALAGAKPLEPCPSSCRCFLSEGLKRADCRHVPEWADQQSDAQDVRILPPPAGRGSRSSALHLTHFEVFPRVLQLAVTNRSIVEVIPSGFHGLHSLQELDLSHNLLSRFNPKVFLRMPALRRLFLAGNPIALDRGVPLLMSKSLLSLDLSHCDIVDVPKGSLDGIRNLTSLSLRNNPLQLRKGKPLLTVRSPITELDLSDCDIDSIPDGVLDGLTSLRRLYLDGNNLLVVERGVLPRGLTLLDLSRNRIRDAPTAVISSLRNLTKLELSDNPIHCTCSLIGLQGWLSRQLVVTERPVVCAEPAENRGKSWTKVDELQLCRQEERMSNATSSSDSSSSSSSSEEDDDGESSSASSTSVDDSFPDDMFDDESLELPPASYEQYTHENVINGNPSSAPSALPALPALPLKVLKLPSVDMNMNPRVLSHNDISYFQADQPYDLTTVRSEEASEASEVDTTTAPETPEPASEAESEQLSEASESAPETSNEKSNGDFDYSAVETNEQEPESADVDREASEMVGKADTAVSESEHQTGEQENASQVELEADDDEREKDAEVLFKNADTIAMGKSMQHAEGTTEAAEGEATGTPVPVTATAPSSAPEQVEDAGSYHDRGIEVDDPLADIVTPPPTEIPDVTEVPVVATIPEVSEKHEEKHEEEPVTTEVVEHETTTVDGFIAVVASADGDRSGHGRSLEGGNLEGHDGKPAEDLKDKGEHPQESTESDTAAVVPETVTTPSGHGAGDPEKEVPAFEVPVAVPTEVPSEQPDVEVTTVPPVPVVEEEIVPAVAKNIVGAAESGDVALPDGEQPPTVVSESPVATEAPGAEQPVLVPSSEPPVIAVEPETNPAPAEEVPEPDAELIPAPKVVPQLNAAPAVPEDSARPAEVHVGESDSNSAIVAGPPPSESSDGAEAPGVERAPPADGQNADSELQKSTITYVILGCIVVCMVALVLYALLRSKKKKAESGKPARIRREEDRVSHPEGTEMKDMMNPLLGSGSTQTQEGERRASLVSLELIREEDDESTRLQPSTDNQDGGPPAAVDSGKTKANGKPAGAVANGKAGKGSAATPETVSVSTPVASAPAISTPGASTPSMQRAAEQPSKVKVKAGVISTPLPRTPVLVNRSNGVNGSAAKSNGVNGVNTSP